MFENKESEIREFQQVLIQEILSSKLGISITEANLIIIKEYARMHPANKRLDINKAVGIREEIIGNGTIGMGYEFVETKTGKFKPLVILS